MFKTVSMTLSHRKKLTIILLLLYWVAIAILTHIPIPQLVRKAQVSDKALHCLAFLILVFLLWFAVKPNEKVNWRKAAVWWVLLIMAGYGMVDELLQNYVGRSGNATDFLANLAGVGVGLILFSIFSFWPAFLVVTAIAVFILTNLARANLAELIPVVNAVFHLFAYGLFTLLWVRNMHQLLPTRPPQPKWLAGALALPTGLLLVVKLFSVISGRYSGITDVVISLVGITTVVVTIFFTALLRRRRIAKVS